MTVHNTINQKVILPPTPNMFELCSISILNWYLFSRHDITGLYGSISITGGNKVGKSSFQDIIQGIENGLISNIFNKAAVKQQKGVSGDRNYKTYILGSVGNRTVRNEDTLCRIMLGYQHTQTNEKITIGVALAARPEDSTHTVEGAFICRHSLLTTQHFVDDEDEGYTIKNWSTAVEDLKYQLGDDFKTYSHSPKSLRDWFYDGKIAREGREFPFAGDYKRKVPAVRKVYRSAYALNDLGSISDFASAFIFNNNNVDVESTRESFARYATMRDEVKMAREEIELLESLTKTYKRMSFDNRSKEAALWAAHKIPLIDPILQLEIKRRELEENKSALEVCNSIINKFQEELKLRRETLDELKALWNKNNASSEEKSIKRDIADLENEKSKFTTHIDRIVSLIDKVSINTLNRDLFKGALDEYDLLTSLKSKTPFCRDNNDVFKEMDALLSQLENIDKLQAILDEQIETAIHLYRNNKEEVDSLKQSIENARNSKVRVPPKIETFKTILKDKGYETNYLYELIDEVDEEWRRVIETEVGNRRFALVPHPDQTTEVITLRREHGVEGVLIIDSLEFQSASSVAQPNSLASKIKTSNPIIRNFINKIFGTLICVSESREYSQYSRVVSLDFFGKRGGVIDKGRPVQDLVMGKGSSQHLIPELEEELRKMSIHLEASNARRLQLSEVSYSIKSLLQEARSPGAKSLTESAEQLFYIKHQIREKHSLIEQLLTEDMKQLQNNILQDKSEIEEREKELGQEQGKLGGIKKSIETLEKVVASEKEKLLSGIPKSKHAIKPDFLQDYNSSDETITAFANPVLTLSTSFSQKVSAYSKLDTVPEADKFLKIIESLYIMEDDFDIELIQENLKGIKDSDVLPATKLFSFYAGLVQKTENRLLESARELESKLARKREVFSDAYRKHCHISNIEMQSNWHDNMDHIAYKASEKLDRLLGFELEDKEKKFDDALKHMSDSLQNNLLSEVYNAVEQIKRDKDTFNQNLRNVSLHSETYQFRMTAKPIYEGLIKLASMVCNVSGRRISEDLFSEIKNQSDPEVAEALNNLMEIIEAEEFNFKEFEQPHNFYDYELEIGKMISEDGKQKFKSETNFSSGVQYRSGGEIQGPYYTIIAQAMASKYHGGKNITQDRTLGMGVIQFDEIMNNADEKTIRSFVHFMREIGLQPIISSETQKRQTFTNCTDVVIDLDRYDDEIIIDVSFPNKKLHEEIEAQDPNKIDFKDMPMPESAEAAKVDV